MNEEATEGEDKNNNINNEKPEGHKLNGNDSNNKSNGIKNQREKPKTVYILRDSMAKKLDGYCYYHRVAPKNSF